MQVVWRNYLKAMRQAGFSAGVGVYVASGLLTYGASQGTPLLGSHEYACPWLLAVQSQRMITPALRRAVQCIHECLHMYK